MKSRLALFLCLGLSALVAPLSSRAQIGAPADMAPAPLRGAEELDHLLGPIALYPDALLAIVLPASTRPVDIVMAIRYFQDGGSLSAIEQQPWDESVRALAHQREALDYLDANLLWTRDLAEAFTTQPEDVMQSIQRLRRAALNAGTLQDSPQHKLIVTADEIRIVPSDPDIIYVPRYDSRVVYVERPIYHHQPLVTFGVGFSVGSWLNYDCDWRHRRIYVIDRSWMWYSQPSWRLSRFHYGPRYESHYWRPWSVSYRHHRPFHVAPIYPRHYTQPSQRPSPRFDDSRRHDRRDSDRRDRPRYDDSRRQTDTVRRDYTPRFQPQSVTTAPAAVTRRPGSASNIVSTAPGAVARVPGISQSATPRQFRGNDQARRPESSRPSIPRVAPENRRAEHVAPRVATVQPSPRSYSPPPAARSFSPPPAPTSRPAAPARTESRAERSSERSDRRESRAVSPHRPRQMHEN